MSLPGLPGGSFYVEYVNKYTEMKDGLICRGRGDVILHSEILRKRTDRRFLQSMTLFL